MGLVPGASLEVVEKAPFNGPITIKVGRTNRAISREVASIIKVKRTM
jgi:Fe2+ transport system protein FeoA